MNQDQIPIQTPVPLTKAEMKVFRLGWLECLASQQALASEPAQPKCGCSNPVQDCVEAENCRVSQRMKEYRSAQPEQPVSGKPDGWWFEFNNGENKFITDSRQAEEIKRHLELDETCTEYFKGAPAVTAQPVGFDEFKRKAVELFGWVVGAGGYDEAVRELFEYSRAVTAQPAQEPVVWKQGSLVTLNNDPYPSLGEWFVQFWEGEEVAARVYGNDHGTLMRRCEVIKNNLAPAQPAQEPVAWMNPYGGLIHKISTGHEKQHYTISLYAHPAPAVGAQPAQEPVAAESKFDSEKTWGSCSIEHHYLVQSQPHKWPGYQTRLLYTHPAPAVVQQLVEALNWAEARLEELGEHTVAGKCAAALKEVREAGLCA